MLELAGFIPESRASGINMPVCINVKTYTAVTWPLMLKPCSHLHRSYCTTTFDPPSLGGKGVRSHLNNMERALDPFLSWVLVSLIQVWEGRGREMKGEIGIMSYIGPFPFLANGCPYIMSAPVLSLIKPWINGNSLCSNSLLAQNALTDI